MLVRDSAFIYLLAALQAAFVILPKPWAMPRAVAILRPLGYRESEKDRLE